MPGSVVDLLFCWYHWLGKHSSDIWNLVPDCLMWTIWTEQNQRSFEDKGKIVVQLLDLYQRTLFDWSRCWGLLDCFTLIDFLSSIRIAQWLFVAACVFLFTTMNSLYFLAIPFLIIFSSYLSKKNIVKL